MITNRGFSLLLIGALAGFIALSSVFGEWIHMYDKVWWWDDMLHLLSGILFVFIGLYVLRLFERKNAAKLSPITIALFTFCFAITAGVLWEIYEFVLDILFGFTMQQWNMPPHAIVMGKSYQGMGLRDTMQDLILACIGALIAAGVIIGKMRRNSLAVRNNR